MYILNPLGVKLAPGSPFHPPPVAISPGPQVQWPEVMAAIDRTLSSRLQPIANDGDGEEVWEEVGDVLWEYLPYTFAPFRQCFLSHIH